MTTSLTYRNNLEVSACIDEHHDNIDESIDLIRANGFKSASILNINGLSLTSLPDITIERIKKRLSDMPINVIRIELGHGKTIAPKDIDKELSIASYFKAKAIQIGIEKSSFLDKASFDDFISRLSSFAVSMSLVPVIEMTDHMFIDTPDDLDKFLSSHKRIKLSYDPCRYMEKSNKNPHDRWFEPLKTSIYSIIARDFKTGSGFYPVGQGATNIVKAIDEHISNGGKYAIFRPSLGRRYGSTVGKKETFKLALEVFNNLFRSI
jgi:hypothetical protein